jgi:hypothetical protein
MVALLLLSLPGRALAQPAAVPTDQSGRPALEVPPREGAVDLSALLARSQDGISVGLLIDELVDELAAQLEKEDARALSPMAVRWVKLSPNLRADLALSVETRLSARLAKGTQLVQVVCTDCRSLRSRIEGNDWVVSLGVVRQADLRQLAEDIGAKTFLDLDIQFIPGPPEPRVMLTARAFRANDGRVLFATSIRGDETTGAVLRSGKKPISREEQLVELGRKLEGRAKWSHMLSIGVARLGWDTPAGAVPGGTVSYRIVERFGTEQRMMYGLSGELFINEERMQAGIVSASMAYQATAPNLNWGELQLGGALGAVVGDPYTMIVEAFGDYLMKFRFSLGAGVLYVVPVKFLGYDFGGFGARARLSVSF